MLRADLPRGTVTMLFADVEGSTRLLYALGERFAPARARLREVVREAAAAHRGHEVDWAGDGVFLAFSGARDALAAAVQVQRALASEPWPAEEALRLRIGVHTGEPELADGGYIGTDVVVAARICSCSHGEQVVVSRATRDVAGDAPLPDVSFRPLGRHRLKDVPSAEHLYQLVAPGLREEFPPLRTLGAASLPALHHRLVGRSAALRRIGELLRSGDVRLVTITGPGGAGKSRLALEVAAMASLERPVHLVGLAPVTDADLVPQAIARALGVRESPGAPILASVADALDGTGGLLFLDNLEHLPATAPHVAELLDRVPDLDVLATSRTPLRLSSEHVLPLEPLAVEDAATLFVELAAARGVILRPDTLASVHEICRRLDGLPLAIELVAARLVVLPPAEIIRALDEGLALDMEGPLDLPERQRTLRSTIDWSYGLLTGSQRQLHGALAVFANGCTLDDARAVSGSTTSFVRDLEALVAWSLVRGDASDGALRLSMLETVREHALDQLRTAGSLEKLRRRHAERFVELALAAEDELAGPDQGRWLDRLELELDNVRLALEWLLSAERTEDALRTISALGRFWRSRGHVTEARRWLASAIDRADGVSPSVLATALWWSARQAAAQDDLSAEIPLLERALALFRELPMPEETAFVLGELGWIALQQGDEERAEELCLEALRIARSTGDPAAISGQLNYVADIHSARGDHAAALAAHEEALALRKTLDDPLPVTNSTYNLGIAAWENGEIARARAAFEETFTRAEELGDVIHKTAAEFMLAELDLRAGDLDEAERRILRCFAVYTELESSRSRAESLAVLGGVLAERGRVEEAARLFGAAEALRSEAPLNRFDAPVLARYVPQLEDRLGVERVTELLAEGSRLRPEELVAHVVPTGAEE